MLASQPGIQLEACYSSTLLLPFIESLDGPLSPSADWASCLKHMLGAATRKRGQFCQFSELGHISIQNQFLTFLQPIFFFFPFLSIIAILLLSTFSCEVIVGDRMAQTWPGGCSLRLSVQRGRWTGNRGGAVEDQVGGRGVRIRGLGSRV